VSYGGGLYFAFSPNGIPVNNTIATNVAANGGGVYLINASPTPSPTLANNIIAFGSSGVFAQNSAPMLRNNCVFGNGSANYDGLPDPTGTEGNLSVDPLFLDATADFHLRPGSPCIDAGDDLSSDPRWLDVDEQARIQGAHLDIGADEADQPYSWALVVATTNLVNVVVATVGGVTYGQFTVTLPDTCYRLWKLDPLTRSGSGFERDFKLTTLKGQVGCLCVVTRVSGAFLLGRLVPGDYTFTVRSWENVVQTIPFNVPAVSEQTLIDPAIATNGLFRLRVNGVAGITYVVQASSNLENWAPVVTNVSAPVEFSDRQSTNFDHRFYRALIGP